MLKDMFFSVFKIRKKNVKTEIRLKLSNLQIHDKDKCVSLVLKKFCNKKKIIIKFTSPYMSE